MEFKDRLRQLRKERKMTQRELSQAIYDTSGTIERYEDGWTPDINNVIKIADYFGVTVDYLIGRSEERNKLKASVNNKENCIDYIPIEAGYCKSEKRNSILCIGTDCGFCNAEYIVMCGRELENE